MFGPQTVFQPCGDSASGCFPIWGNKPVQGRALDPTPRASSRLPCKGLLRCWPCHPLPCEFRPPRTGPLSETALNIRPVLLAGHPCVSISGPIKALNGKTLRRRFQAPDGDTGWRRRMRKRGLFFDPHPAHTCSVGREALGASGRLPLAPFSPTDLRKRQGSPLTAIRKKALLPTRATTYHLDSNDNMIN
jgi:hypothetical protein